jgi:charged multivesicular body protein 4
MFCSSSSLSLNCHRILTQNRIQQVDDQELADELAELEQEELNKRLAGADSVPLHTPGGATRLAELPTKSVEEDEEEAELRELQAALAM